MFCFKVRFLLLIVLIYTMRLITVITAIVLALSIVLYSSAVVGQPPASWTFFRGRMEGTGFSSSKAPDTFCEPKIIVFGNNPTPEDRPPIVCKGRVYIVCGNGSLICIDYKSNTVLWKRDGDFAVPTYYGGFLYTVDDTDVVCLNASTGEEVWRVEGAIKGLPVAVWKNRVIVAEGLFVKCLDRFTGKVLWSTSGYACWSPVVYKGMVYFACLDGLQCINISTGEKIWSREDLKAEAFPAIGEDKLIIFYTCKGSSVACVYALDPYTGETIWTTNLSGCYLPPSACIAYGRVYFATEKVSFCTPPGEDALYALDLATGDVIWKKPLPEGWGVNHLAVADGKVFVSILYTGLYCFDANTGELLWNYTTIQYGLAERQTVTSSPVVAEGCVFIIGENFTSIEQELLIIFGRFKKASSLSLSVAESQVVYGDEVSFTVQLEPKMKATVIIEEKYDGEDWELVGTGITDENGLFSFKWKAYRAGVWRFRVRWNGTEEYEATVSNIVEVQVAKATVTVSFPEIKTSTQVNSEWSIYGCTSPSIAGITVTIKYMSPSGKEYVHHEVTDNHGCFQDSFKFNEEGKWSIIITIPEGENNFQYSHTIEVEVKAGLPFNIYLIAAIAIAVVCVAAVIIIILRRRRAPPPPPPPPPPPY